MALVTLAAAVALGFLVRPSRPPRAPAAQDLEADLGPDVEEFKRLLLRSPGPPTSEESRVLGELLRVTGFRPRMGLPDRAPPEVAGLVYFARWLGKAGPPARAWACFDALLDRHGADLDGSLFEEACGAAEAAGCPGAPIGRLRVLTPRAARDAALARALHADYRERFRTVSDVQLQADPALVEARGLLLPLVTSAGRLSEALEVLYVRVLREMATPEALVEAEAFVARHPSPSPLLLHWGALAAGRRERGASRVLPGRREQAVRWWEKALREERSRSQRACYQLELANQLMELERLDEARALLTAVDREALPADERYDYWMHRAEYHARMTELAAALRCLQSARPEADTAGRAREVDRRIVELQLLRRFDDRNRAVGAAPRTSE